MHYNILYPNLPRCHFPIELWVHRLIYSSFPFYVQTSILLSYHFWWYISIHARLSTNVSTLMIKICRTEAITEKSRRFIIEFKLAGIPDIDPAQLPEVLSETTMRLSGGEISNHFVVELVKYNIWDSSSIQKAVDGLRIYCQFNCLVTVQKWKAPVTFASYFYGSSFNFHRYYFLQFLLQTINICIGYLNECSSRWHTSEAFEEVVTFNSFR